MDGGTKDGKKTARSHNGYDVLEIYDRLRLEGTQHTEELIVGYEELIVGYLCRPSDSMSSKIIPHSPKYFIALNNAIISMISSRHVIVCPILSTSAHVSLPLIQSLR